MKSLPIANCRLPIENIVDCRLPIANCFFGVRRISNWQLATGNWQSSYVAA